ncbi:uncharacterized protein [Euphorbia lathyris]|uniref:uncharacterized protein n=1 Tax=Euphorbia lathyris TaxID=212925 RepID=UPI0033132DD4
MAAASALADAVVGKVANEAVDSVWRHIGYIWNYKTNIDDLQHQLLKLKAERQSMLNSVDEAKRNGEEIEDTATIWLKSADKAIIAAEEILKGNDTSKKSCFMSCCPNLKVRHQFSRKAKKETPGVAYVQQERNFIHKISNRLDVQAMEPVKSYEVLESRMKVLKDITRVLKNDDVNLIGVYGLGGVGKTTLVKQQVVAQVKEEGIFKVVAIANVTHTWDLTRIQQEIADWLGLKFDIESTEVRAARLRARLKQEDKVLIVLDDIWEKIELEKIGILDKDEHEGCKVLMTSRDLNILLKMGVQRHFLLQVLQAEEAWQLFEKKAGDLKNSQLQSIAIEVTKRCAGLPVLIVAVATSLRDKDLYEWNDALEHLQKFDDKGVDEQVYSALELSYKFLGDEAKSLLLLCAQAGGSIINICDLVKYANGLGLFQRCTTIRVLRNRLLKVVNDLKRSCLLLEGDDSDDVGMHDVVHSFATLIASKHHHVFTVASQTELEKWPEKDAFEQCTSISLPHCKIPYLPQVLECPKLESFIFYNDDPSLNIPDKFFSRTKNLKLMDLSDVNLLALPSSLGFLRNLQTLCLDYCVFKDISAIGQLNKLQVLSLIGSNIVQLPMEIRNLTRLQVMDLRDCRRFEVIPPDILICLAKLEELYMLGSFVQWEGEGHTGKRNNASLSELKTLSNLINLEIHVLDAKIMSADLFHGKLERFRIFIGDNWDSSCGNSDVSKILKLNLNAGFELERVKVLLIETEDLFLDDLKGVENVVPKLERQGFPKLKHLQIQNCHEMQVIIGWTGMVDIITFPSLESLSLLNLNKLEKICNRPFISSSFNNLKKLKVGNCNALKNLFSFAMFRCFVQLHEINVRQCEILKEIVAVRYEDETIELTQLHTLTLEDLPQLEGFCSPTNEASAEILAVDEIENLFDKKIQFPNLVELKLSSINVEKLWHNHNTEFCPFEKLITLTVEGCGNLASVLTSSMVRSLVQLKQFEICDCKSMEEVIRTEGETEEIVFPKLKYLKLKGLPKVVKFCKGNLIQCPSMEELWIRNCPHLQTFISTSIVVGRQQDSSTLFDEKVDFPNLEKLVIYGVHSLKQYITCALRIIAFAKLSQPRKIPNNWYQSFNDFKGSWVESKKEVTPLGDNPTLNQIRAHEEESSKAPRALSIIHGTVSESIFMRIMTCETRNEAWEKLKELYEGNERTKRMQLMAVVNKIRLMGEDLPDSKVVEKLFVSLPERFEAKLSSLEDSRDISQLSLSELINSLQAQEQRRAMRNGKNEKAVEGVFLTQDSKGKREIPQCGHCKKHGHDEKDCWYKGKPQCFKCKKFGHVQRNCRNKRKEKKFPTIWDNELRGDSFCKLKRLRVECAKAVVKIFPPNLGFRRCQNLEELYILSCDALTEVFDIQAMIDVKEERGCVIGSQLKTLWVRNTPNLKHVWNEDPKGNVDFQTLNYVDIRDCPSLKSVIPASIARGLLNLEKLYVLDSAVKAIVAEDEGRTQGASAFEFSRLKELRLRRLPQLEAFCQGTNTSDWPALIALFITECNKFHLQTLFHDMSLEKEKWNNGLKMVLDLFQIIPNLEELGLNGKEVRMIREGQLPVELFHKLKFVEFNFFNEKTAVFPYDLLHIFHNLEKLVVSRSKFKELFPPQGVFVGPLILTRMHSLEVYSLPNLKTIWNQVLQTLESLRIYGCDNLIILAPSSASFQSLTSLDIYDCRGLESLVTFSTATSLLRLESLRVRRCNQLKVIVSDEGDEIMDEINFIKLETLVLDGLPSLTSFCLGNPSFKFPSLIKVVVNQCPNIEFFSKGVSSTPLLARVQKTKQDNGGDWLGNLNSTMSFLYKKMVGFCGVQHLKISEFSNWRDRWNSQLPVEFFCDLESLVIDEVAFSSCAIPSNLLEYLNKLDELDISNCEVLEDVFDVRGLSAELGHTDLLSRLNKFHLISLPRLKNIWNEHAQGMLNFKHLKFLKFDNCCSLRVIFTPSMTQGLVQLQEMEVKNCISVEEIISKGAEEDDMISFPQLNSLVLDSLPKLTVFRPGRGIVQCPFLEKITVIECPKIEVFMSGLMVLM